MDLAARVDANYHSAWRLLTDIMERGAVADFDGLVATDTGLPVSWINIAFVTRPLQDPRTQISRAMEFYEQRRSPFVVRIREGLDPAAEAACEEFGLVHSGYVPGMASTAVTPPPAPPDLDVEVVSSPEALAAFCDVMARGFDMPGEMTTAMFPAAVLRNADAEFYLGVAEGRPVATSALICSDDVAGVYNVSTVPEVRKRGYGEALTWHAIAAGATRGCDMAALQASDMGRPIYERMGFNLVSPYRTFQLPEA